MASKFQQRHYEAIAGVMQDILKFQGDDQGTEYYRGVYTVIDELVTMFKRDNSQFTPTRFRAACVPGANIKARTNYKVPA